jgi:HEAT repeat protein
VNVTRIWTRTGGTRRVSPDHAVPYTARLMATPLPAALALLLVQDPDAARLKEATAQIFRVRSEDSVRRGAQMCRDINSRASIEVLLKVLNDIQPHFRDIVWEVLPQFTDIYAQKRIEHELKTNQKEPDVRQWCAELLGLYQRKDFGAALLAALKDRSLGVVAAAARSLGQIQFADAAKELVKLVTHKDRLVRANALEALVRIDATEYGPQLLGALAEADAGVRCALLGLVPELMPKLVIERSTAALSDADWRPRMQAVDNLIPLKSKESIDGLIKAAGDGRPAVRLRAVSGLQKVTSKGFQEQREWQAWWGAARETWEHGKDKPAPEKAGARTVASYHGIEVTSDHVAFMIDKSSSMLQNLKSQAGTKEAAAEKELDTILGQLHGQLTFNVFTYEDDVSAFLKAPVKLDKDTHKKAVAFVAKAHCKGSKNIWNALEAIVANPELDTVFLLSSGEPEEGTYVHWNRVCRYLEELNRFHKVVVHTVSYTDSQWYREQLQKIAAATGGTWKGFE